MASAAVSELREDGRHIAKGSVYLHKLLAGFNDAGLNNVQIRLDGLEVGGIEAAVVFAALALRIAAVHFDVEPPERTQLRKPTESPWYWSW